MKRSDHLRKLTLALGAATLVGASAQPVVSYEINPVTFLELVRERHEAGDMLAVQALIDRMRAMGVRNLLVGNNMSISLDTLLIILTDGTPESGVAIRDLMFAAQTNQISFVVNNQVVRTVATNDMDSFPVGSAG